MEELFEQGKPLIEYLSEAEEGIQKKVNRLYERAREFDITPGKKRNKKCLVFSEFWCPDCLVLGAGLKYLMEIFPGLQVKVLGKEGNEELLSQFSSDGEDRIPLLLVLDEEDEPEAYLSEVPSSLWEVVSEKKGHRDYRAGMYMKELIEALLEVLSG